jgi:hypothetical protein
MECGAATYIVLMWQFGGGGDDSFPRLCNDSLCSDILWCWMA